MPTHTITLRGDVQDVGLRNLIADLGERGGRRGLVFNEADGSVRILLGGSRERADEFVEEIKDRSAELRATIESVEIEAVNGEVTLPPFVNPPTDDIADINRKLGKGIRILSAVEGNTERLIVTADRLVDGQEELIEKTDRLVAGQGQILDNTDRLVDGQEQILDNTGKLVDGQEQILDNTDKLVDGQERMIEILDERL